MWQPDCSETFLRTVAAGPLPAGANTARVLLLAAHPDDETIGASALLGRVPGATVVFLTDGSPRDSHLRSPHVSGSRELYACVRAEEAACALNLLDISSERIILLQGVDQEAIHQVHDLVEACSEIIRDLRPDMVVTHPYEGGHPDHDSAALIARLTIQALAQERPVPGLLEMTSYHAKNGVLETGEFLHSAPCLLGDIAPAVQIRLTAEERARKARMLGCYISQWHVISQMPLEPERLRLAPVYDFSQPPHQGQLWYERLGWPLTGQRWRELASQALRVRGAVACP